MLVRGTKRFVLVSPNTFGLAEFYPNRPKKEKEKPTREKGRKKERKTVTAVQKSPSLPAPKAVAR